ncbi:MAG: PQQ-dependent sugar dehydrogenase [Gemmatimonadota bacterium]|nr:PQQ-dependent sugar dehydrogenase [Gemmatimonadota bacterium]
MGLPHPSAAIGLSLIFWAGASACSSNPGTALVEPPPTGTLPLALQEVATGFSFPLYLTTPPADAERLFVVEKGGAIRIVKGGGILPTPFLDLSAQVSTGSEQGLLGLAFDPQYAANGRFVVHYTDLAGDTRLSLFRVSADPDLADAATEEVLLTAEQPFPNHNGGQIVFGPDGLLYLGLGDGGGGGDPGGRAQSLADLLGSILRIDVSAGAPYTVPTDNPFVTRPEARPEIWSYGLRNPWRLTFDRATGDLYIADVGQSAWEEVHVSPATAGAGKGANYGWNIMEGPDCYAASSCDRTSLDLPVLAYDHGQGCSITGGYVYRGAAIPQLQGHYFYADICQGWVRSFRYAGGQAVDQADWPTLRPGATIPSFGEDAAGELYVIASDGGIFKIVPQ